MRVLGTLCGRASVAELAREVSELPDEWGESWCAISEKAPRYGEQKVRDGFGSK